MDVTEEKQTANETRNEERPKTRKSFPAPLEDTLREFEEYLMEIEIRY